MHTPEELNPAERELEAALRTLRPHAAGVDDRELAFRLGEAVGARRARAWRFAGVANGIGMALLGVTIVAMRIPAMHGAPGVSQIAAARPSETAAASAEPVQVRPPAPAALSGHFLTSGYLRTRERLLRLGADSLGEPARASVIGDIRAAGLTTTERLSDGQSDFDFFVQALGAGRQS